MSEATFERPIGPSDAIRPADAPHSPDAVPAAEEAPPLDGEASTERLEAASPRQRRTVDRALAVRGLPRGELSPFQRWFRHSFSRIVAVVLMKTWFRVHVVGAERFVGEPALYCFNHLSWMDPLVLLATFPSQPRLYFYGPKQVDLRTGTQNRFMWWTTIPVPFSPLKDDLLTSVRRAQAVFESGGSLAISAEGSIHVHEGDLLRFEEGAVYLALRAGVPIVPVAITGTSWAHFRGTVLVRIGEPILTGERRTRRAVARYTALSWHAIRAMVDGDRDRRPPGRFGRYLTDLFNDWGPGGRAAASEIRGPDPRDVRIPPAEA